MSSLIKTHFIEPTLDIPGQRSGAQDDVSVSAPSSVQSFPPNAGEGDVQFLNLELTPPPHVTVHGVQYDQSE